MILNKKKPLYKRKSVIQPKSDTPFDIIKFGLNNENVAKIMEKDNTLVFICDIKATKPEIKKAVVELYGANVVKVRTLNTIKGVKKAFVKLLEEGEALKVANKAGII